MVHSWMHVTMEPVDAIVDPETKEVFIFSRDEAIGETTGCDRCGLALTGENLVKPCVAVDAPAPAA